MTLEVPVPAGERRQLTVLFCDLVGSTAIAERLDPEDWRDTVVRFQNEAVAVIEHAGGYVAQHLGDGLLVYFGYPRAREDDPERALRCGLSLLGVTRSLNPSLASLHDVELRLRVGVHTGPVVVGEVGGARRETLAIGSTANVAARVQGVAEPDALYVTEATLRRVRELFESEDLGTQHLKGLEQSEHLHRIIQPSGSRDRFAAGTHLLTPLVGRKKELDLLGKAFEDAEEAIGRAVAVSGEAGMGKSRIFHAFRKTLGQRRHLWNECRAAAYNQGSPLQPWIELQREAMGLALAASPDARIARIEAQVDAVGLKRDDAVPLFAALHGVPLSAAYGVPRLSPLGLRKRTLSLLVDWLLALAAKQTLVLLIEDLHWLDPSSIELIELLLPRIDRSKVLLLLSYRPDFVPPWRDRPLLTVVPIDRLAKDDVETIVLAAATERGTELTVDSLQAIVSRSDGVPLFAEELARHLMDPDVTKASSGAPSPVPETLEDSLMARLERVGAVKAVAQLASVLGRDVPLELLEALWTGTPEELLSALWAAERGRVLLRVEREEGPLFFFHHALIRDAAYSSLLRKTRRQHHLAVAQLLSGPRHDLAASQPELLAHHLTEAGEVGPAIDAWFQAGQLALGRAAFEEAILHFRQALELIATKESDSRALDITQTLGGALVMARGWAHPETLAAWSSAAALCESEVEPLRAGAIACGLGDVYSSQDLYKSLETFEELVRDGMEKNLPLLIIAGHQGAAIPLRYLGRYQEARRHLDEGLAIYDPEIHHFMAAGFHEEKGISLLCWSAWLHWDVGQLEEARRDGARAAEIAKKLGNPFALAMAESWSAQIESWSGEWQRAINLGGGAANLAAEQGFVLLEAMGRFAELPARGILEGQTDAPERFGAEIARLAATGNTLGGSEVLAVLANLYLAQGRIPECLGTIEMGLGLSAQMQQPWCDAWLNTLKARALVQLDPSDENARLAIQLLQSAAELAKSQGARFYELRARAELVALGGGQEPSSDLIEALREAVGAISAASGCPELDRASGLLKA